MKTTLPDRIETDIVEYIWLENGEHPDDEGALKIADLDYLGRFQVGERRTHFWKITSSESFYATVDEWEDGNWCLGTETEAPLQEHFIDKNKTWLSGDKAPKPKNSRGGLTRHLMMLNPMFWWRMFKVSRHLKSRLGESKTIAHQIASLPLPEAFTRWQHAPRAPIQSVTLRPPVADAEDKINALVARLNVGPPNELLELYKLCDGFYPNNDGMQSAFLPAAELKLGSDLEPKLSTLIRQSLLEAKGADAANFRIFSMGDLMAFATDNELAEIAPDLADEWLLLKVPNPLVADERKGADVLDFTIAMSLCANEYFPAGVIFEFEGGSASMAPSLSALLGEWTAMLSLGQSFLGNKK